MNFGERLFTSSHPEDGSLPSSWKGKDIDPSMEHVSSSVPVSVSKVYSEMTSLLRSGSQSEQISHLENLSSLLSEMKENLSSALKKELSPEARKIAKGLVALCSESQNKIINLHGVLGIDSKRSGTSESLRTAVIEAISKDLFDLQKKINSILITVPSPTLSGKKKPMQLLTKGAIVGLLSFLFHGDVTERGVSSTKPEKTKTTASKKEIPPAPKPEPLLSEAGKTISEKEIAEAFKFEDVKPKKKETEEDSATTEEEKTEAEKAQEEMEEKQAKEEVEKLEEEIKALEETLKELEKEESKAQKGQGEGDDVEDEASGTQKENAPTDESTGSSGEKAPAGQFSEIIREYLEHIKRLETEKATLEKEIGKADIDADAMKDGSPEEMFNFKSKRERISAIEKTIDDLKREMREFEDIVNRSRPSGSGGGNDRVGEKGGDESSTERDRLRDKIGTLKSKLKMLEEGGGKGLGGKRGGGYKWGKSDPSKVGQKRGSNLQGDFERQNSDIDASPEGMEIEDEILGIVYPKKSNKGENFRSSNGTVPHSWYTAQTPAFWNTQYLYFNTKSQKWESVSHDSTAVGESIAKATLRIEVSPAGGTFNVPVPAGYAVQNIHGTELENGKEMRKALFDYTPELGKVVFGQHEDSKKVVVLEYEVVPSDDHFFVKAEGKKEFLPEYGAEEAFKIRNALSDMFDNKDINYVTSNQIQRILDIVGKRIPLSPKDYVEGLGIGDCDIFTRYACMKLADQGFTALIDSAVERKVLLSNQKGPISIQSMPVGTSVGLPENENQSFAEVLSNGDMHSRLRWMLKDGISETFEATSVAKDSFQKFTPSKEAMSYFKNFLVKLSNDTETNSEELRRKYIPELKGIITFALLEKRGQVAALEYVGPIDDLANSSYENVSGGYDSGYGPVPEEKPRPPISTEKQMREADLELRRENPSIDARDYSTVKDLKDRILESHKKHVSTKLAINREADFNINSVRHPEDIFLKNYSEWFEKMQEEHPEFLEKKFEEFYKKEQLATAEGYRSLFDQEYDQRLDSGEVYSDRSKEQKFQEHKRNGGYYDNDKHNTLPTYLRRLLLAPLWDKKNADGGLNPHEYPISKEKIYSLQAREEIEEYVKSIGTLTLTMLLSVLGIQYLGARIKYRKRDFSDIKEGFLGFEPNAITEAVKNIDTALFETLVKISQSPEKLKELGVPEGRVLKGFFKQQDEEVFKKIQSLSEGGGGSVALEQVKTWPPELKVMFLKLLLYAQYKKDFVKDYDYYAQNSLAIPREKKGIVGKVSDTVSGELVFLAKVMRRSFFADKTFRDELQDLTRTEKGLPEATRALIDTMRSDKSFEKEEAFVEAITPTIISQGLESYEKNDRRWESLEKVILQVKNGTGISKEEPSSKEEGEIAIVRDRNQKVADDETSKQRKGFGEYDRTSVHEAPDGEDYKGYAHKQNARQATGSPLFFDRRNHVESKETSQFPSISLAVDINGCTESDLMQIVKLARYQDRQDFMKLEIKELILYEMGQEIARHKLPKMVLPNQIVRIILNARNKGDISKMANDPRISVGVDLSNYSEFRLNTFIASKGSNMIVEVGLNKKGIECAVFDTKKKRFVGAGNLSPRY